MNCSFSLQQNITENRNLRIKIQNQKKALENKRRNYSMKRIRPLYFLLTALLLASSCFPARASEPAEEQPEVLRVGFFAFSGYHTIGEDGHRTGYGYEFLQRLAIHAGWSYEYIGYDESYAAALDMLRNGEVDIVTSVSKTPEREKEFLFSNQDIGSNSTIFTVKAGNENIVEGDYSTYDGVSVGMLEGNSKNDNFARFAKEHDFTYKPVYYAEQSALTDALQRGEIDAAVTGSLRLLENEWLLESFDASPFYICTRKDRTDLMDQINIAINEMDLHDPNWRDELHEIYYATDQSDSIILNAGERAFLEERRASGTPLRLLFNPGLVPYCYFQDGEAKGILPSLFDTLAKRLGLDYEFIPVKDRNEYYALRATGDADVVLDFAGDYYLAEEEGYKITVPYFQTSFARLTLDSFSGEIKKLAVVEQSDALADTITNRYSEDMMVRYPTAKDCVQAVLDGKADATILYSYTAEQYVRQDVRHRLSSVVFGYTSLSYAVGNNVPGGRYLLSILDKGSDSFTDAELDSIMLREIDAGVSDSASLIAFLYRNPLYSVLGVVFVLLLLFTLAMLAVRTRNQRRLEEKVTLATQELEDKAQELTHALQAADAANRAKTAFLNNMSHDIRTPMNAIIGYTALTTTHLDNKERAQDYLTKIAQASNHLLSLINDVLDMSRIESGKVTINERPENLADILQELRNIIQSDVHAKRLELYIDTVDVADEEVYCDKLRLNQILLNLASNAIKFTPVGGTVAVRVTQKPSRSPKRGLYEFRVSDTGIGMSPEFARTVFDPFTREQSSTVSGIQGTGLGMAITKNIVDMMGGTISVESEPEKGTTFTVNLELRFSAAHKEMGPIAELKGFRGLVVDDDMVCCQSVSKMLRQIGMRAEWAPSGREAIARTMEAAELSDPFEVYIVDWSMPELSGIETVREIRKIVGEDSPIILMSAYDWTDIEDEARRAGVTGFISKPLFASDLHHTLERSLGRVTEDTSVKETSLPQEDQFTDKRILLAEDNELNREIAAEILKEAGFLVECAENGKQACDMIRMSDPGYFNLVLMDIQMPIMNGYEATRVIRSLPDPALSGIPIVAMTANAFEEDREQALEAGMNGHLAKPIDLDKMLELLRNLFGTTL